MGAQQKIADLGIAYQTIEHKSQALYPGQFKFIQNEIGGAAHPLLNALPQQHNAAVQVFPASFLPPLGAAPRQISGLSRQEKAAGGPGSAVGRLTRDAVFFAENIIFPAGEIPFHYSPRPPEYVREYAAQIRK